MAAHPLTGTSGATGAVPGGPAGSPAPPLPAAESWKQLLSIATLGVTRAQPSTESLWPPGVTPMPAAELAGTVLRAAVTGYLWQTAGGRMPAGPAAEVPRAPPTVRKPVSETAAWRLGRLLNGVHRDLLPEWFAAAAASGREIPVHWLPTVLDSLSEDERRTHAGVLGPRAAWLASLNPRWQAVLTAPSEELWTSGTLPERLRQLILMRHQDTDRAREWLTQSWPSETPDGRVTLIPALGTRLGPPDEPFLEQALDDKRKDVKRVAADCLARLPVSAHALRNEARLAGLIAGDSRKGRLQLTIELPAALDKAAQRDGLEAKRPQGLAVGERAWWLSQMLARTRPAYWTERFSCTPDTFLDALGRTELAELLLPALASAAEIHPDPAWIRSLVLRLPGSIDGAVVRARAEQVARLLPLLPAADQPAVIEALLKARPGHEHELLDEVLGAPLAWSESAVRLAMTALHQQIQTRHWVQPNAVHAFARRAPVEVAQEEVASLLERLPADARTHGTLTQMAEILEFRATMRQELRADG